MYKYLNDTICKVKNQEVKLRTIFKNDIMIKRNFLIRTATVVEPYLYSIRGGFYVL